jgi:hypothetical protein
MSMVNELVAGDTLEFTTAVAGYPATDGWTLKYRLVPRSGGAAQTLTATPSGADYVVNITPTETAAWVAGDYGWISYVEKTGARQTLESGQLTVKPNSATVTGDTRSQASKAVGDLKAALATWNATNGRVKSYSIAGRSMEFDTSASILELLSYWEAEAFREREAERLAKGLNSGRHIYLRFNRA